MCPSKCVDEERVVVEHLLEVRDEPRLVRGVPEQPAAGLVVDAASEHAAQGVPGDLVSAHVACRGAEAQEELHDGQHRELGCLAESAVDRSARSAMRAGRPLHDLRRHLRGATGRGLVLEEAPRELGRVLDRLGARDERIAHLAQHLHEGTRALRGDLGEVRPADERAAPAG